ncbi:MAG TPA: hypothetical protein VF941_21620, partial [Clostridia bacterium]
MPEIINHGTISVFKIRIHIKKRIANTQGSSHKLLSTGFVFLSFTLNPKAGIMKNGRLKPHSA